MRLLIVEDSARLRELLTDRVHDAGWRVDCVDTAAGTLAAARAVTYDLALVDLGLPDGDGLILIRDLRRGGFAAPILVITARGSIGDRVAALDGGADDYLVKPFNHVELLARCRALLRRRPSHVGEVVELGGLAFDLATGTVSAAGQPLPMAPRERSVLELLVRNAGRVVTKQSIETALSEIGEEISTNAVELAVSRLRRRLQPFALDAAIETVRGIGYLLRRTQSHG
ncbi:response regulator [Labrys wisconsinensis]|uniref:Two-component system response regulator TctD n=1 Tax=Labrys wisconsinensis TaxID=425677 RepID=A0ABU0JJ29_9HYPH|nr:response regulator transcription factor [Labrys wisconsinensis]MDQ0474292.1 two-component system response regulator TctD [Labrys wisconsinensis]